MLKGFIYLAFYLTFQRMNFLNFNEEGLIAVASMLFFIALYMLTKETMINVFFHRANNLYIIIRYLFLVVRRLLRNYRKILYIMTFLKRNKNVFVVMNIRKNWLSVSRTLNVVLTENMFYKTILFYKCLLLDLLN